MAKKKVAAIVKIQIPAGKASPAPPVGTALGPHGVAIMDFVKAYNAATESQTGTIVPVDITIFEDRTFSFVLKTPPTPVLLRERAGLDKASSEPGKVKAGRVTEAQIEEVAQIKLPDLNAYDLEAAKQQVRGTARSHGHRRRRLTPTIVGDRASVARPVAAVRLTDRAPTARMPLAGTSMFTASIRTTSPDGLYH